MHLGRSWDGKHLGARTSSILEVIDILADRIQLEDVNLGRTDKDARQGPSFLEVKVCLALQ
jgi:hypothetical protein